MEAARALADLVEISPQIEAAAVVAGGQVEGSVGVPDGRVGLLQRAVRELLDGAARVRRGEERVTQIRAELAGGDVFLVSGDDERTIVAVTRERTTPGLVFYDLKRCLAEIADET